ncbi:hypothetical protein GOP47_0017443 [Adiantum capillus-veneris]|uniref:Uncharacterized protein n=1 Tax=Adiantum capillus-veneris TaxID=13818 RepID=A0A9D4UFL7_ADICA|nr:hypothetical protein GOP47_0017443 [Adiantum capillus-veneris]
MKTKLKLNFSTQDTVLRSPLPFRIFENLKDYSVKALVNAVDHVGTVAAKLDDLLSKRTKEMSILEFNMSRVTQQLQAYHDSTICEGLNHYQNARRRPRYGLHYALSEQPVGEGSTYIEKECTMAQNMSLPGNLGQRQDDTASDSNARRSLLWHLTSETPLISSSSTPTGPHGPNVVNRSTLSNSRSDKKLQGFLTRSLSGGQFSSSKLSPSPSILNTIQEPVQFSFRDYVYDDEARACFFVCLKELMLLLEAKVT